MNEFDEQVYKIVIGVPKGKVTTYGKIATALGNRHLARRVGRALHQNPYKNIVPCHRVVFSDGSLSPSFAFGGKDMQKTMLEREGVTFIKTYQVCSENIITPT
jgi:methylated-DNA-protein-cysteine methyltransferase-like protein